MNNLSVRRVATRVAMMAVLFFSGLESSGAVMHKIDAHSLDTLTRPLAKGARVDVALQVGAEPLVLQLEKFDIFTPEAEIRVLGDNDQILARLPLPNAQYFRGYLADDPDSLVFMSSEKGQFDGLILTENRRFEVQSRLRRSGGRTVHATSAVAHDVFVMESPLDDDFSAGEGFTCDVHKRPKTLGRFGALLESLGKTTSDGALSSSSNTLWQLNLALETDYELFVNSGSSSANVTSFIGNLIAATSTIYRRDLSTEVFLSYLGIHTTASDPFTVVPGATGTWNGVTQTWSSFHALLELGDRWATPGTRPFSGARSAVHLISGKSQLAGVAWVETVCQGDFFCQSGNCGSADANGHYGGAYGFNGGIDPPADNSVPNPDANVNYVAPSSNYWALLEFAHELGHNVGSDHTHCIGLSPSDQATYGRAYVDVCRNCATNANGSVPAEKGTIMSYCHLLGGGSQTRFTFGKNGEASAMMLPLMRGYVQTYTPTLSLITAPTSVTTGVSSSASVTNVAGITYTWTIINGTINGTSTGSGASINFVATASPVTLKVTATNAGGCSVSDYVTIQATAPSCSYAITPTSVSIASTASVGTVTVTAAAGCAWSAVSNSGFVSITGGLSGSGNGTASYSVVANSGAARTMTLTIAGQTFTIQQAAAATAAKVKRDFNGDGRSDIFWRNSQTGETAIWLMDGFTRAGVASRPSSLDWTPSAAGDFDGDGRADIFWFNASTRESAAWFMNGGSVTAAVTYSLAGSGWSPAGSGDFDGDGRHDIFWRNPSTGETAIWFMNGFTRTAAMSRASSAAWTPAGFGDFDADGDDDIFWQNYSTNETAVWLMSGATAAPALMPSSSWRVARVGDFNGDGRVDLLWRQAGEPTGGLPASGSGDTAIWFMNGATRLAAAANTSSTSWWAYAAGDYDGNGTADLFWRNPSTGDNAAWSMSAATATSGGLPSAPAAWVPLQLK